MYSLKHARGVTMLSMFVACFLIGAALGTVSFLFTFLASVAALITIGSIAVAHETFWAYAILEMVVGVALLQTGYVAVLIACEPGALRQLATSWHLKPTRLQRSE